jgi:hypothetical protein
MDRAYRVCKYDVFSLNAMKVWLHSFLTFLSVISLNFGLILGTNFFSTAVTGRILIISYFPSVTEYGIFKIYDRVKNCVHVCLSTCVCCFICASVL